MYSRNYLSLSSTWVHPRSLVGFLYFAFFVVCCRLMFVLFLLAIAMFIPWVTESDYPFDIRNRKVKCIVLFRGRKYRHANININATNSFLNNGLIKTISIWKSKSSLITFVFSCFYTCGISPHDFSNYKWSAKVINVRVKAHTQT